MQVDLCSVGSVSSVDNDVVGSSSVESVSSVLIAVVLVVVVMMVAEKVGGASGYWCSYL